MQELAILILVFELLLASITAVYEKGHFPLRYLLIFVISALIFYLAINKSTLTGTMILTYSVSISILALIYVLVKFLNKKYSLFD